MNHPMRKLIDAAEGTVSDSTRIGIYEGGIVNVQPIVYTLEYIEKFIDILNQHEKVNPNALLVNVKLLDELLKKFKPYKKWLRHADDRKYSEADARSFYGINNAILAIYNIARGQQSLPTRPWLPQRDTMIEFLEIMKTHLNELITNRSPLDKLYHWMTT